MLLQLCKAGVNFFHIFGLLAFQLREWARQDALRSVCSVFIVLYKARTQRFMSGEDYSHSPLEIGDAEIALDMVRASHVGASRVV